MVKSLQIDTEKKWNDIIFYLKTGKYPTDISPKRHHNFARFSNKFIVNSDPEEPEKEALFVKSKNDEDTLSTSNPAKQFIPAFQKERQVNIITRFHQKTGHG